LEDQNSSLNDALEVQKNDLLLQIADLEAALQACKDECAQKMKDLESNWDKNLASEVAALTAVDANLQGQIDAINALLGIFGTVLSGWVSDKLFRSDRYVPALIFGAMNSVALVLFLFGGDSWWLNITAMVLFGISIGVLICFLGGLMAVDVVPRKATGAALGVVGAASYVAAGIQDVASGWLIDGNSKVVESLDAATGQMVQSTQYDFTPVAIFWVVASIISFLLPILNWKKRKAQAE
jgi:OPA family sugar phosphate sensor protein UhpC-like MFS transporter